MNDIQVMLVDDNALICDSMPALIETHTGFKVCASVMNRTDAMTLVREKVPDVCLVDISLNGEEGGLDLMREIKSEFPSICVLAVSLHDEDLYAARALKAGADGYLSKSEIGDRLAEAVERVRGGDLFVSGLHGEEIIEHYRQGLNCAGGEMPGF